MKRVLLHGIAFAWYLIFAGAVPTNAQSTEEGAAIADRPAVAEVTTSDDSDEDDAAAPQTANEWLARGDALADEGEYEDALVAYKNAYELIVPKMRLRDFQESVEPRFMTRPELQRYMAEEFRRQVPEEELVLMDRSLKVFGFAPPTLDAEQTLLSLYTEEVAGFYNPETKEIFLIREAERRGGTLGAFSRILGLSPRFNKEEQKTTLVHEMTHALADQHFDLDAMDDAAEGNDDMMMAISGLIEGEATLLMFAEMTGGPPNPQLIRAIQPREIDAMFQVMSWTTAIMGGRTMRNAPSIFRRGLIFPYHKGTVFATSLAQRGGWASIDDAFADPPISTEQILHPERYFNRDQPTAVALPDLTDVLPETWTFLGENTLGEFQIQVLLEDHSDFESVAAGWDGDRYSVWEHDNGQLGLVWYTVWDSESDAEEFEVAYREHLEKRFADADTPFQVVRQGADVYSLEGFSDDSATAIGPLVKESLKSPLEYRIVPAED